MRRRLWLSAVGVGLLAVALPAAGIPPRPGDIRPPTPPAEISGAEALLDDRARAGAPAGDREAGRHPSSRKGPGKGGAPAAVRGTLGVPSGRPYPLDRGERFTWAGYRPASGSGLFPLSGVAELGFMEARGELPASEPAGRVPPLPADFSPNVLVSQDLSSMPHNETSVAINPRDPNNIVVGANDYRFGFGTSGFYATTDGGKTWRDGLLPSPSVYF
ncbi:MAG: hypothetical protein ACRDJF_08670, partial [Actinomycetota bacterium]